MVIFNSYVKLPEDIFIHSFSPCSSVPSPPPKIRRGSPGPEEGPSENLLLLNLAKKVKEKGQKLGHTARMESGDRPKIQDSFGLHVHPNYVRACIYIYIYACIYIYLYLYLYSCIDNAHWEQLTKTCLQSGRLGTL